MFKIRPTRADLVALMILIGILLLIIAASEPPRRLLYQGF